MKKIKIITTTIATVFGLAGCGGGGSSSPSADPQGYWIGKASTGYTVNAAILENGEA